MTFTIYLWPVVIGHGEDKQDVPHWFITVLKDEHMEGSEDIDFYSRNLYREKLFFLWITCNGLLRGMGKA